MLFVTTAAFLSCCLGLVSRKVEGKNLSAAEANRRLRIVGSPCQVPDNAANVDFQASYLRAVASFELPFEEFTNFCDARAWNLRRVDPQWPITTYDVDYKMLTIANGYYYKGSTHRGGYDAHYDIDRRRAWIDYSHH